MHHPVRFGIVGSGWRAAYYLRIAQALPHLFEVSGLYIRSPHKYQDFIAKWRVPVHSSLASLAADSDFVVTSVSKTASHALIKELTAMGAAVLAETPPAVSEEQLLGLMPLVEQGARIQIAEQYHLQPHHQARTALVESGRLGSIQHTQVSAAHGYHGISLLRKWLNCGPGRCEITARRYEHLVMEGPHRGVQPSEERLTTEVQDIALFAFDNGTSGVMDFSSQQYYSPVRNQRILIRGTKGELQGNLMNRYAPGLQLETLALERVVDGQEASLIPLSLKQINLGLECLYHHPFHPAPLSDEEIAIAEALSRMAAYVIGGASFYSLAEALQDTYLSLCIDKAIHTKSTIVTEHKPWN